MLTKEKWAFGHFRQGVSQQWDWNLQTWTEKLRATGLIKSQILTVSKTSDLKYRPDRVQPKELAELRMYDRCKWSLSRYYIAKLMSTATSGISEIKACARFTVQPVILFKPSIDWKAEIAWHWYPDWQHLQLTILIIRPPQKGHRMHAWLITMILILTKLSGWWTKHNAAISASWDSADLLNGCCDQCLSEPRKEMGGGRLDWRN